LLHLIRQADKVNGHMRASRFAGNGEGKPDLVLALRVKTRSSPGAGCSGKEFPPCEHRSLDSLLRLERPLFCGKVER
jgi:hypothetical protein